MQWFTSTSRDVYRLLRELWSLQIDWILNRHLRAFFSNGYSISTDARLVKKFSLKFDESNRSTADFLKVVLAGYPMPKKFPTAIIAHGNQTARHKS